MKVEITEYADVVSFNAHPEDGEIVIDECKGLTPQEALSVFPDWAIEAIRK